MARLPSRAFPPPSPSRSPSIGPREGIGKAVKTTRTDVPDDVGWGVRNDGVDWKMMLRLGVNWSNGNALSQTTISLPPSSPPHLLEDRRSIPPYTENHIALFPSFIFTSSPTSPLVRVHLSDSTSSNILGIIPPPLGWSSPSRPDNVTCISADQSVVLSDPLSPKLPARLVVFYRSGGFVILHVRLTLEDKLVWKRESVHPPSSRPPSLRRRTFVPANDDPTVLATLNYPILLSCTLGFHVSIYQLSSRDEASRPQHLQTLHSDVSFHPATLSLFPTSDQNTHFKAALTYCTPLYPASWTIAVQEIGIDVFASSSQVWRGECWNVGRYKPDASIPTWPRKIRPVIGVRGKAVGVGMDGRWCVLAGEDAQIQVYSLPSSPASTPIVHSQTLLAHASAVTSISLSSGRCVSSGRDGRLLVWELDEPFSDDEVEEGSARICRSIGYVEVRKGGRKEVWRGATGPELEDGDEDEREEGQLPHPQAISSAARALFLPRPPDMVRPARYERIEEDDRRSIRQLVFDEEKIVGLVGGNEETGEVMKVWSFN
ncbi:hypothetical protein P7C73_g4826, partial [Tremellales sp. Uapishka_1]